MGISTIFNLIAACAFVGIGQAKGQKILNTGTTLSLNDILYYLPGKPFSSGHSSIYALCASSGKTSGLGLVPVTVVTSTTGNVGLGSLQTVIDTFGKRDDVWSEGFLSGETLSP